MATDFTTVRKIEFQKIRFHEKIGEGAFGAVNRVTFNGLIRKSFNGYTKAAAKTVFKLEDNEITIMNQLQHRHIVKLIGFSQSGATRIILLEFAPNGSLHDYLSDPSKHLTDELKKRWAKESALAIQYLHEHNYLHRDIKPSNCLLFEENLLKLCDFGLAREIKQSETTSSIKGTYRYMAPELHVGNTQGRAVYSKPADIYAYGMLLLEVCTRRPPFPEWEWHKVVFEVGNGTKPTLPKECPDDLAKIIQQCWSSDSNKRPPIDSIVKALSRCPEPETNHRANPHLPSSTLQEDSGAQILHCRDVEYQGYCVIDSGKKYTVAITLQRHRPRWYSTSGYPPKIICT